MTRKALWFKISLQQMTCIIQSPWKQVVPTKIITEDMKWEYYNEPSSKNMPHQFNCPWLFLGENVVNLFNSPLGNIDRGLDIKLLLLVKNTFQISHIYLQWVCRRNMKENGTLNGCPWINISLTEIYCFWE